MTTPNELYKMEPERVTNDISYLVGCYYNHVKEVGEEWAEYETPFLAERIEVRYLKDYDFDGRRVWKLATVWFDGEPVMITQNAGREGDDHSARFITDGKLFMKMCHYIKTQIPLTPIPKTAGPSVVDPGEDIQDLTEFYGNSLDGPFERYRY